MKMKLLYLICLVSSIGFAQPGAVISANKKFEQFAYADAIKMYERLAEKGYKSADMFQKLGDAYYYQADYSNAAKWYDALFKMKKPVGDEYYFKYSQSLKALQQYDKADQIMSSFAEVSKSDSRAKLFVANRSYLDKIKANSGRYILKDAGINSNFSDYGTSIVNSKLVFTSARDTGSFLSSKHKWTNQSFTNLYSAQLVGDSVSDVKKFDRKINSRFNESTPIFTKDGKTMYFTRNNYIDGKKEKSKKDIVLLKIYRAELVDGNWTNVTELPFSNNNYNVAHPALSPDESYLYFASDMPGTIGKSDIFRVKLKADGSFGKPENLGKNINTEGRETFPTISADNELYFASDGIPGLGGLDIFVAQIATDNNLGMPQNVGEPANSAADDFGLLIDVSTRTGYLTSNREGGKGFDDIYKFTETRKLKCDQLVSGIVTDFDSAQTISGATVRFLDADNKQIDSVLSDAKGGFSFKAICGERYIIRATKSSYTTYEKYIKIPLESGVTTINLQLQKDYKEIKVGTDLAKVLEIKTIYFDLDKSDIREDAAFELEKVLDLLKQYPALKIDIRSHTDTRQTQKYNLVLSQKRADSTLNWLVENGIDASRLSAKGYGESQLINKCADGIDCSEEQHQQNRRSEFIVLSL